MRMAFVHLVVPPRVLSRQLEGKPHRVLPVFKCLADPNGSRVPLVRELVRGHLEIIHRRSTYVCCSPKELGCLEYHLDRMSVTVLAHIFTVFAMQKEKIHVTL